MTDKTNGQDNEQEELEEPEIKCLTEEQEQSIWSRESDAFDALYNLCPNWTTCQSLESDKCFHGERTENHTNHPEACELWNGVPIICVWDYVNKFDSIARQGPKHKR